MVRSKKLFRITPSLLTASIWHLFVRIRETPLKSLELSSVLVMDFVEDTLPIAVFIEALIRSQAQLVRDRRADKQSGLHCGCHTVDLLVSLAVGL